VREGGKGSLIVLSSEVLSSEETTCCNRERCGHAVMKNDKIVRESE